MKDNVVHILWFTPKKYLVPLVLLKRYLATEASVFLITEDNKKIKL